jgi:hypothetical protein
LKSQLSDDLKTRIQKCQNRCNDLTQKFYRTVAIGTNMAVSNIQLALKTIDDKQLGASLLGCHSNGQ